MPDITMCANDECPLAYKCFRHKAEPNEYRQPYAVFKPDMSQGFPTCKHFWLDNRR